MRVWFQADISWSWREDGGMFGTNPEDQRAENLPGWTASDRIFCSFNKHQKCGDFHKRMKICGRLSTRLHHLLQFLKPPLGMYQCSPNPEDHNNGRKRGQKSLWVQLDSSSDSEEEPGPSRPRPSTAAPPPASLWVQLDSSSDSEEEPGPSRPRPSAAAPPPASLWVQLDSSSDNEEETPLLRMRRLAAAARPSDVSIPKKLYCQWRLHVAACVQMQVRDSLTPPSLSVKVLLSPQEPPSLLESLLLLVAEAHVLVDPFTWCGDERPSLQPEM
ncbi:hypothetical protein OJAV_G00168770 [Oryzias javanicus]|uniref:Uncharacterized protein n=1 Tax=Oryzias javanicus TaxID=123683 RepID=A0A437CEG4_ORYJA|nr:hypothetical protein OJAV_G00168770 [Oryzias javanicus]